MLEPESIKTDNITAIEETWADRLEVLRFNQLKIDFQNETNLTKLDLWLESFGILKESLPEGFSVDEYQRLLESIILLLRKSGTPESVKIIGYVLGASDVEIVQDFELTYNGEASYNSAYSFDCGEQFRVFIIRLEVNGIAAENQAAFIDKLKRLFEISQPVWIYLERVDFV